MDTKLIARVISPTRLLWIALGLLLALPSVRAAQPNGHTLGGSEQFPIIGGTSGYSYATSQDIANFTGSIPPVIGPTTNLSPGLVTDANSAATQNTATWMSYLTGTSNPNPVVFGGATSLNAGGVLSGTFTGSPTLSGSVSLTGGGNLSGTFVGSPTFSGSPVFNGITGNGSALNVMATGGAALPSLASRFATTLNWIDYYLSSDTDSTAFFNRAVTRAQTLGVPVKINLPCGTYNVSSAIAITTSANQGLYIQGDSASCVTINQTADADVFDVSLTNYGGIFATGGIRISGIHFSLSSSIASTTRAAVSISSTAVTGTAGVPLQLNDLTFTSNSGTSYWGDEILITEIPNDVFISRINGYQSGGNGVHISINGNSTSYTTSVFIRDAFLSGGNHGIELGNYLQGIHLDNINTVGTAYGLYSAPTAGINEEINLSNSYLIGKVLLAATSPGTLSAVKLHHNYFDALSNVTTGQTHVTITNVGTLVLDSNTYNGNASVSSLTGLSITGPSAVANTVTHEIFENYAGTSSVALAVNATTYPIMFDGLQFVNNTTNIADTSSVRNPYSNSIGGNVYFSYGVSGNGSSCPGGSAGTSVATCTAVGADTNIQSLWNAKGLPGTDFSWRDGSQRNILALKDSQNGTSSVGWTMSAAPTGTSPSITVGTAADFMLGTAGAIATTATGGMPQIPYMAGKPTGVPATTGGASMVYDTSDNWLCVYNPTGTAAWKCSAAFSN